MASMAGPGPGQSQKGPGSFLQVSDTGTGGQALGPSSTALPGALTGSWIGSGAAET